MKTGFLRTYLTILTIHKVDLYLDALDQISPLICHYYHFKLIILFCIIVEMDVVGLLRATILFTVTVY